MLNAFKRQIIRGSCLLFSVILAVVVFAGCSGDVIQGNYTRIYGNPIESGLVASNSEYELHWDNNAGAIRLVSLKTGKQWSDILYDSYLQGNTSANGNSPICITVANTRTLKWDTLRSYSELETNANIVCKKIENGIRVTYFFDTYKIAIPIEYTLRSDSLAVSVNSSQILEDGNEYKLVSVALTPHLCSVKNSNKGAYLFVPSGSGAIMYTSEDADGTRTYSGEVYGADAARQVPEDYLNSQALMLPVFGAADGDSAMLGIIEQGAGTAVIEAQAGNSRIGYSNVGANLYLRGYDVFRYSSHGTGIIISNRVSERLTGQKVSVAYYPLYGEDANYNGMAKRYRQYLLDNGQLKKSNTDISPYSVTILGGTEITKSILGIPKKELVAMTDFTQAKQIVSDLAEQNNISPTVRMMYYGNRGLKAGSIGKDISSVYGTKKEFASFSELCSQKSSVLFMDYDIVRFTQSGAGFSVKSDSAQTAINHEAVQLPVSPIRLQDEDNPIYILSRSKLESAAEKVLKVSKDYSSTGTSLSSLGSIAYSDYSDKKTIYANKNGIENQVTEILNVFSKNGSITAVSGANVYAACKADVLFDIPDKNGDYDALSETIPFYQMVFHSYKPMYSQAINISENADKALMNAAAYGMGLGFEVCHSYIDESNDLEQYKLYASVFEDNKELIYTALVKSGFYDCYKEIAQSQMECYEIMDNSVSKTVYSNGKTVWANHSSEKVVSPVGEIAGYGFVIE